MQHERKLEVELDLDQDLLDGIESVAQGLGTTTPDLIETIITAFVHASRTDPQLIASLEQNRQL